MEETRLRWRVAAPGGRWRNMCSQPLTANRYHLTWAQKSRAGCAANHSIQSFNDLTPLRIQLLYQRASHGRRVELSPNNFCGAGTHLGQLLIRGCEHRA